MICAICAHCLRLVRSYVLCIRSSHCRYQDYQLKYQAEMASQSQGIQQLLAAEKKAAELVADARKSMLFLFH